MHFLAVTLGMTVNAMLETLTMAEYARWNVYFEERELERKRAENRRNNVIDFSDPEAATQMIAQVNGVGGGPRPLRQSIERENYRK